jgi:hypothetical protein
MSNEDIIDYLIADIKELIEQKVGTDENDSFYDYLSGVIDRSASVLRMLGITEDEIPTERED